MGHHDIPYEEYYTCAITGQQVGNFDECHKDSIAVVTARERELREMEDWYQMREMLKKLI